METQIHTIFLKNGHKWENIISGSRHSEVSGNITSGSENMNKNVFLTIFLLIMIISCFPLYVNTWQIISHFPIFMGPDGSMFRGL